MTLTTTSYVVLGLVASHEPVTSYDLKRLVSHSIGYFWSFPHSQLYAEPARLATAGLLDEETETSGRRRRRYRVTPAGRDALNRWLGETSPEPAEIRDLGLLKLFFGAMAEPDERRRLAEDQLRGHEVRGAEYEAQRRRVAPTATPWELATLEMGLRFERAAAAFWAEIARSDDGDDRPRGEPATDLADEDRRDVERPDELRPDVDRTDRADAGPGVSPSPSATAPS
jgi:PadR family transcriptional regulator AphA